MATSTPQPQPKPGNQVRQVGMSGAHDEIVRQVAVFDWPSDFGPPAMVFDFVLTHMPVAPEWRGTITVTAYRTTANSKGSGTAYLSVRWTPGE